MSTINASLDKLTKRLDVISASLKSINQTGLKQLTATTLGIDELNIIPKKNEGKSDTLADQVTNQIENRAQEFAMMIESAFKKVNNFSFDISIDKLFDETMQNALEKSDNSDWLSTIAEKLLDDLLSGELFKKFKNLEILLAGGLIEGDDFFSKLADAFALAAGGAGTLSESLRAVFGTGGGIASMVAGAFTGVANFVDMLKNGFSWMKELMMIIGIALTAVGAVILGVSAGVAALVAAVVAGVATAVVVVKDNWEAICTWFAGLGEWFDANVITPVITFLKSFGEGAIEVFSGLWRTVCEIWGVASEWFDEKVIGPVVSVFEGFFLRIQQVFEGLWIIAQAIWILTAEWFQDNVIIPIINVFEELYSSVSDFFINLWDGIKAVWKLTSTWFKENVIFPIIGFFAGIWISVSAFFEGLWEDIQDIWIGVSGWFDDNVIQPLLGFFTTLWDGIKNGMVSAMNAVIQGIEEGINFIIRGINSLIGGFNDIVSWAAKVAEVEWGGVTDISEVSLKRIQMYETGGYPERASLFWANEYGVPELIGTVGSKTAVASGTEITGIVDAVYNTGQEETSLLTAVVNLLQEIADKDMSVNIGDREIARANYRGQKSLGSRLITSY